MSNPNLFSTYSDANMLVSTGLTITYDQQFSGTYWQIARYARKTYQFFGLTEEAAYQCAAAKRAQYLRTYSRLNLENLDSHGTPAVITVPCCLTDISPRHDTGNVWSVDISVNESDVKAAASPVQDPATLFTSENGRSYDETGSLSALTLTAVTVSGTTPSYTYTQNIGSDFDPDGLVLQYKTSESSTEWHSAATVPAGTDLYFRLVYGLIQSNTYFYSAT